MYHKIIVVGNLGRDPEMRYTPSGQAVTNFSVATNRRYTASSGERVDETVWFRISAWGRLGETCHQYLKMGRKVLVEGRLVGDPETGGPRIWDGQDGKPRASFEINAVTVQFLSGRNEDDGYASQGGPGAPQESEEDIPF